MRNQDELPDQRKRVPNINVPINESTGNEAQRILFRTRSILSPGEAIEAFGARRIPNYRKVLIIRLEIKLEDLEIGWWAKWQIHCTRHRPGGHVRRVRCYSNGRRSIHSFYTGHWKPKLWKQTTKTNTTPNWIVSTIYVYNYNHRKGRRNDRRIWRNLEKSFWRVYENWGLLFRSDLWNASESERLAILSLSLSKILHQNKKEKIGILKLLFLPFPGV